MKKDKAKKIRPEQEQAKQPGSENLMKPKPKSAPKPGTPKLNEKVVLITGGDSGIGKAVALACAREGANICISYLDEHKDAKQTAKEIKKLGHKVHLISGDIGDEKHCKQIIKETIDIFGGLDVLVNNAAVQYPQDSLMAITSKQLKETFTTNIFAHFYLSKAALPHLKRGSCIICTTSVTAYRGSHHLIDYAATKGAIVAFIRSLSASLAEQGIRVNGVAPGPVWTPLIPSSFSAEQVATFGSDVPLQRAGDPNEIAPCYVFLASEDASYLTGQVIHPNGGEIING